MLRLSGKCSKNWRSKEECKKSGKRYFKQFKRRFFNDWYDSRPITIYLDGLDDQDKPIIRFKKSDLTRRILTNYNKDRIVLALKRIIHNDDRLKKTSMSFWVPVANYLNPEWSDPIQAEVSRLIVDQLYYIEYRFLGPTQKRYSISFCDFEGNLLVEQEFRDPWIPRIPIPPGM